MNVQIDDVDFLVFEGEIILVEEVLLDQTSVLQAAPSFSLSSLELFSQAFLASTLHNVLMRNNVRVKAF